MTNLKQYKKFIFLAGLALFIFLAVGNVRADSMGDTVNFNVDKNFDINSRTQLHATLIKVGAKLYFYVDKNWWNSQTLLKQSQISSSLDNLSSEFDNNIYPKLTTTFGSEWNPGIDSNSKITILLEPMNSSEGGYFRESDEYDKLQMPTSNEREMLYLSVSNVDNSSAKIVLGHEFIHLITFNQKNKIYGAEEDTWLNEARADYASTILGYDDNYNSSNLQQRVEDFIKNPLDSITDWTGTKYDYASANLFTHYLVDHYGINILSSSLKSRLVGVDSINQALSVTGAKENFAQIFTNWTIASVINDCSQDAKYCYLNQNLKSFKINPTLIFLPLSGDSSLSSTNITKNWAGNWQKIIGGNGNLKLDFSNKSELDFQLPYIIYDENNGYSVNFLTFSKDKKGEIVVKNFGTKYDALIIIPSLQANFPVIDGAGVNYQYSFTVSITGQPIGEDPVLMQKLLDQIDSLKKQIAAILAQRQGTSNCQIAGNIIYGAQNNVSDVKCLQTFLKNKFYYYASITGYVGPLTKAGVIKLQKNYSLPATGNVDNQTKTEINQILTNG